MVAGRWKPKKPATAAAGLLTRGRKYWRPVRVVTMVLLMLLPAVAQSVCRCLYPCLPWLKYASWHCLLNEKINLGREWVDELQGIFC